MVKVRSVEGSLITAESYTELLKAVKNEIDNYDGFEPEVDFLTRRTAIIYHTDLSITVAYEDELAEPPAWAERKCCECGAYDWGKGCQFREGHITLTMPACDHFTLEVRRCEDEEV